MKVNRGLQDLIMKLNVQHADDFICMFFSGTVPTEDEVFQAMVDTVGNFVTGDVLYLTKITQWLGGRGSILLAHQKFSDYRFFEATIGELVTTYAIDLTSSTSNAVVVSEGTISHMVMVPTSSSATNYNSGTTLTSAMFFSVGLPDSGADIELTSLDLADGDNIRMNNISFSI